MYSGFAVGAAVLMNNGEVVCGTNQENVAYPSGLCAERTALFYACSTYPETGIKAIAIAARDHGMESGGSCHAMWGLSSSDGRNCSTL